ncbi:5'-nucleotidase (plasmid) [Piscirickettsia salmonis]|nr:5'-nucleotidase [Piscirickettsia salmonis]
MIAVSSSALFDLSEAHEVFTNKGKNEYKKFQEDNLNNTLQKGVAFPFIKRFLSINQSFPDDEPVEVVLLSRNSPATGKRVFRSIQHYDLNISRAAFMGGSSPYNYIPAFNASLFLSGDESDVKKAINFGYPAGLIIYGDICDDAGSELRVAFDFDGVIADDEAESVLQKTNDLKDFHAHEVQKVDIPHKEGPLIDLFKKLSMIQKMEEKKAEKDSDFKKNRVYGHYNCS